MDPSSSEYFGALYHVYIGSIPTEDGLLFYSTFYLERYIGDLCVSLIVNDKIRPATTYFCGEVEIFKCYNVFTYLPPNEYIKDCILSIKNFYGLEVGLWKIYENVANNNDEIYSLTLNGSTSTTTTQSSSSSSSPLFPLFSSPLLLPSSATDDELTSPTTDSSSQSDELSCVNCDAKTTPLWRKMEKTETYCNACFLYLKRTGTHRKFDANGNKLLRKKREKKSRVCAECNTNTTPTWRNFDDKTYCNKHGLAKKKEQIQRYSPFN